MLRSFCILRVAPELVQPCFRFSLYQGCPFAQRAHAGGDIKIGGVRQHGRADQVQIADLSRAQLVEGKKQNFSKRRCLALIFKSQIRCRRDDVRNNRRVVVDADEWPTFDARLVHLQIRYRRRIACQVLSSARTTHTAYGECVRILQRTGTFCGTLVARTVTFRIVLRDPTIGS